MSNDDVFYDATSENVTDISTRDKRVDLNATNVNKTEFVDFCDDFGNYHPASLGARPASDTIPTDYTLVLPGKNPVATKTSPKFTTTLMPGANDQVLVASPKCTIVDGKPEPDYPGVLEGKFIGLSSGFYSDFIPISGVPVPYQGSQITGMLQAEQINVSYMWTRVGDIVTLNGTAILAGNMAGGSDTKWMDIMLPIPLSDNVPVFSGVVSYISTAPNDSGNGFKGRGANARDPRFFGLCDMITSVDMNQSNVSQWNNFKIHVWPKEWSRNAFRIEWVNSGDNSPDAQFRFHVSYSLAPIMPNGAGTLRYVVDRQFTSTDPGNWD